MFSYLSDRKSDSYSTRRPISMGEKSRHCSLQCEAACETWSEGDRTAVESEGLSRPGKVNKHSNNTTL